MELKIGDRVKGTYITGNYEGSVYSYDYSATPPSATIKRDDGSQGTGDMLGTTGVMGWEVKRKMDGSWGADKLLGYLVILSHSNISQGDSMPNIREQFALSLVNEPQKSFRKAGITGGDDLLTGEGANIFLSWLLHNKYAADFKKDVVDAIITEKETK